MNLCLQTVTATTHARRRLEINIGVHAPYFFYWLTPMRATPPNVFTFVRLRIFFKQPTSTRCFTKNNNPSKKLLLQILKIVGYPTWLLDDQSLLAFDPWNSRVNIPLESGPLSKLIQLLLVTLSPFIENLVKIFS